VDWVKLYATFATDPKVVGLSDKAFRRYIEGMCYAGFHETDGWAVWPQDRFTQELKDAGLVEESGFINGWLNRQRSKAEVDAKRIAGRKAAGIRWGNGSPNAKGNAEPNTEVEVEVEGEVEVLPKAPPTVGNATQPVTHDELYLAERITDSEGKHLSPAAIQKLNRRFSTAAVTSALRRLHGFPPPDPIGSVYAYVESLCQMEVTA
jgi:hypothetical protein